MKFYTRADFPRITLLLILVESDPSLSAATPPEIRTANPCICSAQQCCKPQIATAEYPYFP